MRKNDTCLLYTSKLPKERKDTEDKLTRLGEQILKSVDIAGLLELAENAPELQEKKTQGYTSEMVENLAENAQYSTCLLYTSIQPEPVHRLQRGQQCRCFLQVKK